MARTRVPHRPFRSSRRDSFKAAAVWLSVVALGAGWAAPGRADDAPAPKPELGSVSRLSEHLAVYHGPINVGIVHDGGRALLIDCGDGRVRDALKPLGIARVEQLLFTHHHRDQACGAYRFVADGAKAAVPGGERDLFSNPAGYWNDDRHLWNVSGSYRPHPLTLVEPLAVDRALAEGDVVEFGPAKIRVLATPGHTEGSIGFLVEVDGRKVVFSGDAICDKGQIWDVHSLQKGFSHGGRTIGGYHGFMGDRWQLAESLAKIKAAGAAELVPSHGRVMRDPAAAIDALTQRLEACYENYVAISALRHYFPELFTDYAGRPGQMPIRPGIKPPDCLRHFGTTWMIVSKTGAAFVMDAGWKGIVDRLKEMLKKGEIRSVDALWVTHYHSDHTGGIPEFQKEFDCPCITDRPLADVLTRPRAWRLPCLAPDPVVVHKPMDEGQSWQWHEFKMTAYNYPGQTLYHDALLVEGEGVRMFFVGDSHTPAGIDDYCAYNRNFLGRGVGFQYCISLIEKLQPTHIFNCHVDPAFTFTPEEIHFMRQNLDEREKLFGALVAWDHANYGLDGSWARCDPYTQEIQPGKEAKVQLVVTNHSASSQKCRGRVVPPKSLGGTPGPWVETEIPAKQQASLPLAVAIPADVPAGRYVAPVDLLYGPWDLPQFTEMILEVKK